ncbi:EGF-like domain-containing protein [Tieghemostelium lacteum]|uniref:EGF-like domain-containing protein n=1 Tax=Tieghemostelium lacteum TaxID=361077 RepID=A0A152A4V9_TIELA|nr:EGF-like domain-containing protein [Tieghemostelium lacteum]|eukprot:KYR01279.1 EGF-like domain-containing protein [Tieghemostelium lacteum]
MTKKLKLNNRILVFLIFIVIVNIVNSCQDSFQCGNSPLSQCKKSINILDSIELDYVNGRIMFLAKYSNDKFPKLLSIPTNGGFVKYHYSIFGENPMMSITSLYRYLPISGTIYLNTNELLHGGPVISYYNNEDSTIGFQLGNIQPKDLQFDEENQQTFGSVDLNIIRLDSIPISPTQSIKRSAILYRGMDWETKVKFNQNNLYIRMNNTIYIGDKNCQNCSRSQLSILVSESFVIQGDLQLSTDTIFYLNRQQNSIIGYPLSGGQNSGTIILSIDDKINDFIYYDNSIYYLRKNSIYKLSLTVASIPQILYDGNKEIGDCQCSDGFSGETCLECSVFSGNNTIIWNLGSPYCIPISHQNQMPLNCFENSDCNAPFGQCFAIPGSPGICQCLNNFSGINCQSCQGTITWKDGSPYCNK